MENQTKKFVTDVAPIARLRLSRQLFFSYQFNQKLEPGTLVTIPLFNREIEGVVLDAQADLENSRTYKLKSIAKVIQENFLTAAQVTLANELSDYYLTSLGVVLKHFLPKRVHARISTQHSTRNVQQNPQKIILTTEQSAAVSTIADSYLKFEIKNSKFLLYGPSSSGKTEVYLHSILKLKEVSPESQFLILLPELTLAPQAIQRYSQYFDTKEIALLHSKLGKGEFYANWEKIRSGEAKIVIATRIGIFAPFQKLGLLVVDEEQDMSFKQWDMNPRYDARKGAEMLSDIFSCPLVLGTATPRIETFQKTQTGEYKLLNLPKLIVPGATYNLPPTTYHLTDMRKEKWTDFAGKKKPNHSLLSLKLQEEISYALKNKLQIILFVNHQGTSAFSICKSCKTVLKCPKCDRALVLDDSGLFKCLHCNHDAGIVPKCKACGALEFQNIGIGTQAVAKEIKKLFPTIRGARLDSGTIKKPGMQEIIYRQFYNQQIDVLVGTQMITKGWDNPNVGLIGIIDSDSLFSAPDFLTDERAYANIMQTAGRTSRFGSKFPGQVVIQTFNPNQPVFKFIAEKDYKGFFEKEVKQREALHYPPFGKITKLTFQEADETKLEKEIQKIHSVLSQAISNSENLRITEPSKPLVSKIRGKHRMHILLRNFEPSSPLPPGMVKIIGGLSTGWIVDVDPISIA
jgi:primosomal protein N' (replication factor Y)